MLPHYMKIYNFSDIINTLQKIIYINTSVKRKWNDCTAIYTVKEILPSTVKTKVFTVNKCMEIHFLHWYLILNNYTKRLTTFRTFRPERIDSFMCNFILLK